MIAIKGFSNRRCGRLGNQIFKYAFLFGLSKRRGYDIGLPVGRECQFFKCFDILNIVDSKNNIFNYNVCENNRFRYNEDIIRESRDNTIFNGAFQSYRYFDFCKEDFIKSLRFKESISHKGDKILKDVCYYFNCNIEDLISLHIRRGDYLKRKQVKKRGNLIKNKYYEKALVLFGNNDPVLVFSDDVDFVSDYFNDNRYYVVKENEYISLYMMSKIKKHIIANSSFSYMGAYLSRSDDVVYPSNWVKDIENFDKIQELTKLEWIRIK